MTPGIEWARREIMIFVAGPIAERLTCRRPTLDHMVAVHEAGHVVVQFLLGKRLAGASIVPWPGHSSGRATSRKPTLEDLKEPWPTDEQMTAGLVFLGDLDRAQIDASTEDLLTNHWPLVRHLAQVLVERKEISGRRARQLLFRAQRKELRRARAVAEKDRRNQQTWAAEIRQALGRVA
jgi:hypothetical protein